MDIRLQFGELDWGKKRKSMTNKGYLRDIYQQHNTVSCFSASSE